MSGHRAAARVGHRWFRFHPHSAAVLGFVAALLSAPAAATGDPSANAPIYVLRYAGIVCVKAPCPVWESTLR